MMQIYKEFPAGVLPAYPNGGWPGLSKREWFAGMALQGLIASESGDYRYPDNEARARGAVKLADAIIAELNKEPAVTQSNAYDHS